jgi:hypothetical protein
MVGLSLLAPLRRCVGLQDDDDAVAGVAESSGSALTPSARER